MAARAAPPGPASFETAGKSRPPQDEGFSSQPVKTTVSRNWSCIQSRCGRRISDTKKPGAVSRPGIAREFQFREYSDLHSGVNTLFSAAGANSSGNIFRLAPGQMPEFGMFLSPMLRILRRRSIKLSDPSKLPVRRPAYCAASDACVPDAVRREARTGVYARLRGLCGAVLR
jgi:hypothetical protein